MSQTETPLLTALLAYSEADIACFDVPGHKRGVGVPILRDAFGEQIMRIDTNSSPKLDNVANPQGVIGEAQALFARAYDADASFFLTNGTTSAIHVMILTTMKPGEKILLPRNIHKSALNALILSGAMPVYLQPEFNSQTGISENVSLEMIVEQHRLHPDLKAVFLLNPTYYGFVSELKTIVEYCHAHDLIVMVDEAHGAHFHFHADLPDSGMQAGADLSSVSMHKTGGALTQASALLVKGNRVDAKDVQQAINMLQTTSSSYLLMASLDGARQNIVINGETQLDNTLVLANYAREQIKAIPGLVCVQDSSNQRCDETKLGIQVRGLGMTGFEVYDHFWQVENIQLEMADLYNVLAIFSLGETQAHVDRLIHAFQRLAERQQIHETQHVEAIEIVSEVVMSPRDAYYAPKHAVELVASVGFISGESILAYPPGIPIIAPGERISQSTIQYLQQLQSQHAYLTDHHDPTLATILIIEEI